ncbi:MAG: uracil-DNA glycosylase family protein [Flavobacteriales bacterium]|nr:uracil-DNA glycosylase family protein [Flavobacteriales bacterium]
MRKLLDDIAQCTLCAEHLPLGPRPVVTAHPASKVVIIGQAPGIKVHESGVPWDDASGKRLREWLGVSEEKFYDPRLFALVPMGFCYPGKGKSGDLPPRQECAPTWHRSLMEAMPALRWTILIGAYAQKFYLSDNPFKTLTDTVRYGLDRFDRTICLPHPSPRNNIWLKKNEWFERELIPELQLRIQGITGSISQKEEDF